MEFSEPQVSHSARKCFPATHRQGTIAAVAVDGYHDDVDDIGDDGDDIGLGDDGRRAPPTGSGRGSAGSGGGRGGGGHGGGGSGGRGGGGSGGGGTVSGGGGAGSGGGGGSEGGGGGVYIPRASPARVMYAGSGSRAGGHGDDGPYFEGPVYSDPDLFDVSMLRGSGSTSVQPITTNLQHSTGSQRSSRSSGSRRSARASSSSQSTAQGPDFRHYPLSTYTRPPGPAITPSGSSAFITYPTTSSGPAAYQVQTQFPTGNFSQMLHGVSRGFYPQFVPAYDPSYQRAVPDVRPTHHLQDPYGTFFGSPPVDNSFGTRPGPPPSAPPYMLAYDPSYQRTVPVVRPTAHLPDPHGTFYGSPPRDSTFGARSGPPPSADGHDGV